MTLEENIRKLAKKVQWQEIYRSSQDCSGIRLFKNDYNFSGIQYLMIHWLRAYSLLYQELSSLEWENLDIDVINDNVRCDAFLFWRSKELQKKQRQYKKEAKKNKPKKSSMMPVFTGATKDKEGNK